MKKYNVSVQLTAIRTFSLYAEDEDDANEKAGDTARELFIKPDEADVEVVFIYEVKEKGSANV